MLLWLIAEGSLPTAKRQELDKGNLVNKGKFAQECGEVIRKCLRQEPETRPTLAEVLTVVLQGFFSECCAQKDEVFDLIALELLDQEEFQIDYLSGSGTPLMVAWKHNRISIFDALLYRGANVNIQDKQGETCLHWAASQG